MSFLLTLSLAASLPAAPPKTTGTIDRKSPQFDLLIPPGAEMEKLADGFKWSEGPVWNKAGGYLLFSDIPNNKIMKWSEAGGVTTFMENSGYSGNTPFAGREPGCNGLTFDREGRLVMCRHGDRCVARIDKDGKTTVLVDRYNGKRFNSPNDLCYGSDGALYFTDPPYGLPKGMDDPAKELAFQGVYRLSPKGDLTLLTKEMTRPNGIALSPDEKTLYVANSDPLKAVWMAFDLQPDGAVKNERVFFDATLMQRPKAPGLPDGLKLDMRGNLFATGPGGVLVLSPKGEHLGTLETGVPTANCGWGDDGSVLYVTANTTLLRIRTSTRGK